VSVVGAPLRRPVGKLVTHEFSSGFAVVTGDVDHEIFGVSTPIMQAAAYRGRRSLLVLEGSEDVPRMRADDLEYQRRIT
jgi:hypothetical protein